MDAAVLLRQQLPADLETQGYNPAIIQEAIDKLDAFQVQARAWLFKALSAQAKHASPQQLSEVLGQLCDCTAYLLPDTPEAQLVPHAQHFRDLTAQIEALEQQLLQEEQVEGLQAQVQQFESYIAQGQYGEAAWLVVSMGRTLRAEEERRREGAGGEGTGEAAAEASGSSVQRHHLGQQAYERLRGGHEQCEARLSQVLTEASTLAMQVDPASRTLVLRSMLPPSGAATNDLWAALAARGQLEDRLRLMADDLTRLVLEPVLSCGMTVSISQGEEGTAHLSWGELPPGHMHDPESCCQKLLKLVAERLFNWDEELLKKWGDAYWRRMSDAYVRLHARPFVKAHADDATQCSAKAEAARGLEEFAESLGVVDEPYLGPAVEALSRQVLCARQQRYLQRARDLILSASSGRGEPVRVGLPLAVDQQHCSRAVAGQLQEWEARDPPTGCSAEASALLACGQYSVSAHTPALLELVEGALQDAVSAGEPTIAEALVGAVSKIALMARILPNQQQLQQAPHLALLHYNDLRHLADTLLLLPACFGTDLAPLLAEGPAAQRQAQQEQEQEQASAGIGSDGKLSFLADVALLRKAADDVMGQQVHLQQQALSELCEGLAQLRRLGRGGSAQAGLDVRKCVTRLLHSMGRLGRAAAAVLAPEPLLRLVAALLGPVCSAAVVHVLSKRDIDIDDIKDLKDALHPLAHDALHALLGMTSQSGNVTQGYGASDSSVPGVPTDLVTAAALSRCTPLRKLRSLLVLLDADLKEFVTSWSEGLLQRDGWEKAEVERLVGSLFEDSDYRRQALARIRETSSAGAR